MLASTPRQKFKCSICYQKFTKIEDTRAHIKATHLLHLTCPVCDRVFVNIIELTKHKKLHFQAAPNHILNHNKSINEIIEAEDKAPPTSLTNDNIEINLPSDSRENVEAKDSTPLLEPLLLHKEGKAKESSAFSSNERSELITHSSLFSERIVCFPGRNQWKVTDINVTPSRAVKLPEEENCAVEEDESGEGSEMSVDKKDQEPASSCNMLDKKTEILQMDQEDTLGIRYKDSSGTFNAESTAETDNNKNANVISLPYIIDNKNNLSVANIKFILVSRGIGESLGEKERNTSPSNIMKNPPKAGVYACNVCKNEYNDIDSVRSHKKVAHANHLRCLICNEILPSMSQYLSHSNAHLKNPQSIQMDIINCDSQPEDHIAGGSMASNATNLCMDSLPSEMKQQKLSKVRRLKEYKCKLCREKYLNVNDVRIHVKEVHLNSLTCELCDLRFTNKYSLMAHAKSQSHTIKVDNYPSKEIRLSKAPKKMSEENYKYLSEEPNDFKNFYADIKGESRTVVHIREKASNKCDKCNLYFDSKRALQVHKKTHKNVLYKCGVCNFASSLKKVIVKHLNEKNHSYS